ncbi:histidine kinase [Candidatus Hamiltonella defensa]|uniref:Histidine kinase n=1 Tax=Candidatus Williamhamiltonella defendens TaxID=138072 RepID=A0AAC9VKJ4_9ENTR|nr:Hpt domain-containing protein [Candidatus Hamiltonella defensa]ASV33565.1 histidine kinase [Candidatus Hamiltonella defensa]AWK16519.1 histidine kinase [Candidatus Hamiltonella defensa]MBK4361933.1 histidine kinase [Candidatus Hamiltonella defensa]
MNDSFYQKCLISSEYYPLFVETVRLDVQKLYRQGRKYDFISLSKTTHRLKGMFALLNLFLGQELCEVLEQHIANINTSEIKKSIHHINLFVSTLVQQGEKGYDKN